MSISPLKTPIQHRTNIPRLHQGMVTILPVVLRPMIATVTAILTNNSPNGWSIPLARERPNVGDLWHFRVEGTLLLWRSLPKLHPDG